MKELLSPVGNMDCLKQAIFNGADAVYVGLKSFGARKFANNFTEEEIIEAIKICHIYNVKIYVTMNTLIKDSEVESFINQVDFLYKNNVDAIIMQDFGMICLIRKMYPELDIHASTQANNSKLETIRLYHSLGVKRVVVSRELSLEEINQIDVPIEIEAFIHGALCISYSGNCLMSSMIGTRSGNRGECAGSCRLPYTLMYKNKIIKENKYLISTKELNTSSKINELLKSKITSFKIEGRMKSKEYVGFITNYYRKLIDKKDFNLQQETNKLKTIYNRNFTTGNVFDDNTNIINENNPNHIGLPIGKVIEITKDKIKIKLNNTLNQQDGIRFIESNKGLIVNYLYDKNNKLISSSNNICYIENKIDLKTYDTVSKTYDYNLMKELNILKEKKLPINIKLTALIDKPLKIEVSDKYNKIVEVSNNVEKSISCPISKERIKTQIEKLGNTPYIINNTEIIMDDNIYISIKELNELRRKAIESFTNKRISINNNYIINKPKYEKLNLKQTSFITTKVRTEEQLLKCLSLGIKQIYVDNLELYNKYKDKNEIYYYLPRCLFKNDQVKEKNLVNDYFKYNDKTYIGDYFLNVYNIYTAYYLYKLGLKRITLSVELNELEIKEFIKNYQDKFNELPNIEVLCYGKVENMLIKGNVLNIKENDYNYQLIDMKKRVFDTYYDGNNTHILNYENKNLVLDNYLKNNINIRLDFYNEKELEIEKTVKNYL